MTLPSIGIIGGGLAGCECALVLAEAGLSVSLFEMKPERFSPAHSNEYLAELVCSNSFRSDAPDSAVGLLKEEMRALGSLCMAVAEQTRVPAGKALAVDRELFAREMTRRVTAHPNIRLVRETVYSLPASGRVSGGSAVPVSLGAPGSSSSTDALIPSDGGSSAGAPPPDLSVFDIVVVAAGPLAGEELTSSLLALTGQEHLYFYDAIAPVVDGASINMDTAFWGARYHPEDSDYLNCPMTREEYFAFHAALLAGQKVAARNFEKEVHFEGCMPVEALAERGDMTLAFGPLKPVGFIDPRTGQRPFALLQLRAENANKTMFNLVGCQTKLTFGEQARIFRMIPGLENAEFVRFGSMHRNTFVNAPKVLAEDLSLLAAPHIHLAGQITGVEGYVESAACGLWLGLFLAARAHGKTLPPPPPETSLGALLRHLRTPAKHFQPSNVQFGLMPELGLKAKKANRKELYATRARAAFVEWREKAKASGGQRGAAPLDSPQGG